MGEYWTAAVEQGKGVVFTCGSGMTAAVGWLANEVLKEEGRGAKRTGIYDEVRWSLSSIQACSLLFWSFGLSVNLRD